MLPGNFDGSELACESFHTYDIKLDNLWFSKILGPPRNLIKTPDT